MCVNNLVQDLADVSYVIGTRNGITKLEIIDTELPVTEGIDEGEEESHQG